MTGRVPGLSGDSCRAQRLTPWAGGAGRVGKAQLEQAGSRRQAACSCSCSAQPQSALGQSSAGHIGGLLAGLASSGTDSEV